MKDRNIPRELPPGLSLAFAQNPDRVKQWNALLQRVTMETESLEKTISDLNLYVSPLFATLIRGEQSPL